MMDTKRKYVIKVMILILLCLGNLTFINWWVNTRHTIFAINEIKKKTIKTTAQQALKVPKIAHFVSIGGEFPFFQYLSLKSIQLYFQPKTINVYNETKFYGRYWDMALSELKNLNFKNHNLNLTNINGTAIRFGAHKSDWIRINEIYKEGGLYIDTDVWLLQPLDRFEQNQVTMGYQNAKKRELPNAAIMAMPKAKFVERLLNTYYNDYRPNDWDYNSVRIPGKLATKFPDEIWVENTTWMRPNWKELNMIYDKLIPNFHEKYMLHLWHTAHQRISQRVDLKHLTPEDLWLNATTANKFSLTNTTNTTLIVAARKIFFADIVK